MRLVAGLVLCALASGGTALAQAADPGRVVYDSACARCHGADGNGGEHGPAMVLRLGLRDDAALAAFVHDGLPAAGMPGFPLDADSMAALIRHLRTLRPARAAAPARTSVATVDGGTVTGTVMNQTAVDLQVLTDDKRIRLLRREGDRYRVVTSETDWPTYHGVPGGNRYTPLAQIDKENVRRLAPRWTYSITGSSRLEVTPVVVEGVMYVTTANECHALDAGSGRRLWDYRRPRTKGLAGDAASGINRGVAVAGDRVFMVTDNAHLLALDRHTGALLWDTEMADSRQNYGATSAPLAAAGLVLSGSSGGDEGARGFVAAFDPASGREVWRFWTVPKRGEPGSETWQGSGIDHPCATAWFTGTYDSEQGTLYWPTGNPCPDYDGGARVGDNLYSDSILALDVKTGALKWHFQYTPHDVWDWDAQQPAVLVDTAWHGQPRRLLLQANRNGFFYVLDRTTGALLLATPFVKKLTWAREIGADGRPVLVDAQDPIAAGRTVCPAVEGATNWFSTSFHPGTGLYYVQALEKCTVYTHAPQDWVAGKSYYGGTTKDPEAAGTKVLRAIDIQTGAVAWELPQIGSAQSWGGILTTASGLLFFGEDGGAFMAVDAATGAPLWHFQANAHWKASPMTYTFDGRQYVAVAAGSSILSFALLE
jgi:alcohol dehydrogenase (cytochrome c)